MLVRVGRQILSDAFVEAHDLAFEVAHVVEAVLDEKAMVIGEVPLERALDVVDLGRQPPMGQAGDLGEIQGPAGEKGLEQALARRPEHIGEDRAQLDVGVFEDLLDAVAFGAAVAQERLAVPGQVPQVATGAGRDEAGPDQAVAQPEQARGEDVDDRTDIWSLRVVLYEMLAGEPPFQGENLLSLSHAIAEETTPGLPRTASSVQTCVSRALSKDREQRHETVRDLVDQLRQAQNGPLAVTNAATADTPSIAVLPFSNMSADPEQEYFSVTAWPMN